MLTRRRFHCLWVTLDGNTPSSLNHRVDFLDGNLIVKVLVDVCPCRHSVSTRQKVPRIAVPVLLSAGPLAGQGPGTQLQSTTQQRCFGCHPRFLPVLGQVPRFTEASQVPQQPLVS
ncbi:hypothetical protein CEP54_007765 [Fusarium duplospermum]|uniref:Uncharacterized protein n=1 Tax=Fusarium duplospermum TaxID=1325734 RepID=A0A428PZT5_9HYPO|nr:hypothetical protein CEP54_007765 [Fusarium duplospermum]